MLDIIEKSKYFDSEWYKEEYPTVAKEWPKSMAEHYWQYGGLENRNPGPCFDAIKYKALYCTGSYESWNPLIHYEKVGKNNNIIPPKTSYQIIKESKYFDKHWYEKKYGESISGDSIRHYLNIGWKEGFNPGKKFDGNRYLNRYPDVAAEDICPLLHYELLGKNEDREVCSINQKKYSDKGILLKSIQKIALKINSVTNSRYLTTEKILVHLHLFYFEAWDEIKYYLNNLSIYSYDLCVTYPENCSDEEKEVLKRIKEFKDDVIIYPMPNRGFDIGPFIEILNRIDISNYDLVIKLHSKGIHTKGKYIYNRYFEGKNWFEILFRGTIGTVNTHKMIRRFAGNQNIGMTAAKELIVEDPLFKQKLTAKWGKKIGITVDDNYSFVAGTCFAVKSEVLQEIKKLNLSISDFDESTRGEFSLAHALERIFCYETLKSGKKIVGMSTFSFYDIRRRIKAAGLKKYSTSKLLEDNRFVLDDDFFFRILDNRKMKSYSLEKTAIKDIIRVWNGEKLSLKECAPYKYLLGEKQVYEEYCDYHKRMDLPLMTPERFNSLIDNIQDEGFDEKHVIVINQDNVLLDGQHRACWLLYKYGEDYMVNTLKIYFKK